MDKDSLAHSKWNCKYHIVFAPKYRRQIIYKQISADIGRDHLCPVRKERDRNSGGSSNAGSHTPVCEDTAEVHRGTVYAIPEK